MLVEVRNISRKASTAKISGIYSTDNPTALATRTIVISPASGTAAAPMGRDFADEIADGQQNNDVCRNSNQNGYNIPHKGHKNTGAETAYQRSDQAEYEER
jgi:hypothetical protein